VETESWFVNCGTVKRKGRQQLRRPYRHRATSRLYTSPYYPKAKAGFSPHAVKTSDMSFHQGTLTGLFSNPEASTIGK
jgi:hypothetical protein